MLPTPLPNPVANGIYESTATLTPQPGIVIGSVDIDQTTPGTTNGVQVNRQPFGTLTNRSGTIAAGGTPQNLAAVNANRKYLFIQNVDSAESLWVNFTTPAVADEPSIELLPGWGFEMTQFVSTELVSVIAATTGHKFTAKEG